MCARQRARALLTDGRTVVIQLFGHDARTTPSVPEVVSLFGYEEALYDPRASGRWRRNPQSLAQETASGTKFPVGALRRVTQFLEGQGYTVAVEDRRRLPPASEWLNDRFLSSLSGDSRRLADEVIDHDRGIIKFASEPELADQIALVARISLRLRVLIALPTRNACQDLENLLVLRGFGVDASWADNVGCEARTRVAYCTYRQFATSNCADWQMVLLPHAEFAIAERPIEGWKTFRRHRIYAFVDVQRQFKQRDRLGLEMLAGQVIFTPPNVPQPVRGRVQFVEPRLQPVRPCPESALARKRARIWRNQSRNAFIVNVAQSLAAGRLADLWDVGILLRDQEEQWPAGPARTVVVVESPEHARHLASHLPDWTLVAMDSAALTNERRRIPPNSIATVAALNARKLMHVDAVIRADGGEGLLDVVSLMPPGSPAAPREVLLVDVADAFDDAARASTWDRFLAYESLGQPIEAPSWLRNREPAAPRSRRRRRP